MSSRGSLLLLNAVHVLGVADAPAYTGDEEDSSQQLRLAQLTLCSNYTLDYAMDYAFKLEDFVQQLQLHCTALQQGVIHLVQ
jgi:hypothetical protein